MLDKTKLETAIAFFEDIVRESDEMMGECTTALQEELAEQKAHFVVALEAMRTPLPDNKALTVEELREMDGQPVYLTIKNGANGPLEMWALVDVVGDTGAFWLRNNLGGRSCYNSDADLKNSGIAAYSRPPEKGE